MMLFCMVRDQAVADCRRLKSTWRLMLERSQYNLRRFQDFLARVTRTAQRSQVEEYGWIFVWALMLGTFLFLFTTH